MKDPNFLILYVDDPMRSARFYEDLLGYPPIDASPGFAMFALKNGTMLGLWAIATVQPAASSKGGGQELAFTVDSRDAVEQTCADWRRRGLPIAQAPLQMDFGYTFVALDPDQHRLRVFVPQAA